MENFSLIFPAFGIDYLGNEDQIINNYSADISFYLKKAEIFLEANLNELKKIDNELYSQIDAYIYSCIISDILKKKRLCPSFLAYYSMGIYSALYFSGSITFEYGLYLIKTVYETCLDFLKEKRNDFTMALIIGLDYDDVLKLIRSDNLKVEIINQNNRYNIIISGLLKDINIIMEKAISEGALKTKLIPTKIAFHSEVMKGASQKAKEKISLNDIKDSPVKIISAHDQKIYTKQSEIKEEIIKNIAGNINWMKTFNKLLSLNNKIFIEAGPGESLTKIAKFIEGDFRIYAINKFDQIINDLITI